MAKKKYTSPDNLTRFKDRLDSKEIGPMKEDIGKSFNGVGYDPVTRSIRFYHDSNLKESIFVEEMTAGKVGPMSTRSFAKTDNHSWPNWFLLSDVTDYYNGVKFDSVYFRGIITSYRPGGYVYGLNGVAFIDVCLSGYDMTSNSRILRSSSAYIKPYVVSYGGQYHLALRVHGYNSGNYFFGLTNISNTSFTELLGEDADGKVTGMDIVFSPTTFPFDGNATTATALATPRKLWGQSFDGTKDVNGDIMLCTETDDTNSDSAALRFYGSHKIENVTGPVIKATNLYSYGKKRLGFFVHGTDDFQTLTEAMSILYNGRVGIGTIWPDEALDVRGNIKVSGTLNTNGNIYVTEPSNIYKVIRVTNSLYSSEISVSEIGAHLTMYDKGGGHTVLSCNGQYAWIPNFNLGIKKSNPSEALDVNGNIKASGTVMADGATFAADMTVKGNAKLKTLDVDNDVSVSGNLETWGFRAFDPAQFMDDVSVAGDLKVDRIVSRTDKGVINFEGSDFRFVFKNHPYMSDEEYTVSLFDIASCFHDNGLDFQTDNVTATFTIDAGSGYFLNGKTLIRETFEDKEICIGEDFDAIKLDSDVSVAGDLKVDRIVFPRSGTSTTGCSASIRFEGNENLVLDANGQIMFNGETLFKTWVTFESNVYIPGCDKTLSEEIADLKKRLAALEK